MLILLALAFLMQSPGADPHRQFDFWVGEWSVQNRHLQPDGSWKNGDVTRARITPVIDGKAVLEEWAGPFRGTFMNGFSLRAYDPATEDWDLLLFWTTDGNSGFGKLRGKFRHGRGEFFSSWQDQQGNPVTQRYSFSDGLPNSVRWDSAITNDGGQTWKTDWIMEFSRTRAAVAVTQDRLFDVEWTEGKLSPHAEARQLDWMRGEWRGTQTGQDGVEREARLRSKLLNKDCLIVDVLATRDEGESDWDERLCVRGWIANAKRWERWRVDESNTKLRPSMAAASEGDMLFEVENPADGFVYFERLSLAGDVLVIEEGRRAKDEEEYVPAVVTRLTRVQR